MKSGSSVAVETRLSESPAIRKTIATQVRQEQITAGARDPSVKVLSAYKQGYLCGLTEQILPELRGKGVKSIATFGSRPTTLT